MISLLLEIIWTVIVPIAAIVALGIVIARNFPIDQRSLNVINLYVFVPALAFTKFLGSNLDLSQVGLVALFWLLLAVSLWVLAAAANRVFRVPSSRQSVSTMGAMFPNSGNYGLPVIELAFGSFGVAVQSVVIAVHNLLFFSVGTFITGGGFSRFRRGLSAAARIPVLYAIFAAFLLRNRPELLPYPLGVAFDTLGQGLVPVALLTLGAQLGANPLPRPGKEVGIVVVLRLLAAPVVAWGISILLNLPHPLAQVLIVSSAFPAAVNTVLLAIEFRRQPSLASSAVLWTTVVSVVTVTVVIALARSM